MNLAIPFASQQPLLLLTGALDQLDSAKRGAILFYRETTLEPGKYNIERSSTTQPIFIQASATSAVVVPDSVLRSCALRNLIVVGRAQKSSPADPEAFKVGELMLYPNLGRPYTKPLANSLVCFSRSICLRAPPPRQR
jgi:hypothetical protein